LLFRSALMLLAGLAHAASMANPWNGQPLGWLQLVALTALVWQLRQCQRPAHAAGLGWLFATGWLAGTFWWLFVAMHTYGGLAAWLAAVAVVVLAAVLATYYALAAWAFVWLKPAGAVQQAMLFAAVWTLAELARGVWFTGFGWGGAAYAHTDALARSAQYVGAYGVTALLALIACLLALWIEAPRAPRKLRLAALAGVMAGAMAWSPGDYTVPTATLEVALLQGNIAQDEKFVPGSGVADSLRWYGEQLATARASLVVAPETAIPLLPAQLPPGYWSALQQRFASGEQAALVGVPLGSAALGYTNSVVGFKPGAASAAVEVPYRYDKHHLVPFGEFVPPLFRWFTAMMAIPLGDFNRGAVGQASFEWRGQRLAPNVCYEDLFGEELAARFVDPARAPTIFVNVSNIGWFGQTVALDQHLQISRMRVLEFARPFIRATNTGDTVIIDYRGRVTHALERHTRGVLVGSVQGRDGLTPFAWWVSRFGLWPLWLIGVAVVALAAWRKRAGGHREGP